MNDKNRKQEKSCGAVIFRKHKKEAQVLVIHQVQGHYCFPKGHVEKGESEKQTAKREILEETGLKVKIWKDFRHTLSYSPSVGVLKEVIYFLATPKGGKAKVQLEEVSDMAWMSIEEARNVITFDNDKELLEHAVTHLAEKYIKESM